MFLPRAFGRCALFAGSCTATLLFLLAGQQAYAQTPAVQPPAAQTPTVQPPAVQPPATTVPPSSQPAVPGANGAQHVATPAVPAAVAVSQAARPALPPYAPEAPKVRSDTLGSVYIPVDSMVYPMALRLYSMGYLDTAFINMRPWTRRSLLHMLQQSSPAIIAGGDDQAIGILAKLDEYIASEGAEEASTDAPFHRGNIYGVQSIYTRVMGISGQTLRDSYHLGETISNDYNRPYEPGFNNITGFSTIAEYGRFSLFVRGEYQHAPAGTGYSTTYNGNPLITCVSNSPCGLAETLSNIDEIPFTGYNVHQTTIPAPLIAVQNPFSLLEATFSFHALGHEISAGKSDSWDGPGYGSAMNWSDNAQDGYTFRIDRIEPLYIPWISRVLGPLRYDFFVGSLKGHSAPNEPWVHNEMFSFAPTSNFQFAFSRTVIWGGHGHGCEPDGPASYTPCDEPITLHTFFTSFFSITDTSGPQKYSRDDPGARFSDFSFSWRLPFVRRHLTLYTDSIAHDDVSPISAPRRASYRPGIYLSQVPGIPRLDLRVEGVSTDCSTTICQGGTGEYWEVIQRQGYTNQGTMEGADLHRQGERRGKLR